MELFEHQIKCAKDYPNKALICWEGGTGKTVGASVWLHDKRDEDALVIAPKRIIDKWSKELHKWETKATVISKDNFKKIPIKKWSAIVVDEADEFASPLFLKKGRSQLSTKLYELIKFQPETPILLLTATPVRSNPWNLHTLLCFLGIYIDWQRWRKEFFYLQYPDYEQFRFLQRPAYFPKPDWIVRIQPYIKKYADIVLMKDCVGDLPPSEEIVVKLKSKPFVVSQESTSSGRFYEQHQWEQKDKLKDILKIAKEYRKVLVVAYYVEQTEELKRHLSKDRLTFMVNGTVKKQEEILEEANKVDECFLIVQAGLGAGFDADTFPCVIFVSMSYKVRDYVQMKFRVRRIHNLNPVRYYYLLSGKCDKNVYETIQKGRDFVPSEWTDAGITENEE